jgi:hypothetical protein
MVRRVKTEVRQGASKPIVATRSITVKQPKAGKEKRRQRDFHTAG